MTATAQNTAQKGFRAPAPATPRDIDDGLDASQREFLKYLAACFYPDSDEDDPAQLFPQHLHAPLMCFALEETADIRAVAEGSAPLVVSMDIDGDPCPIEVQRDSIMTDAPLTMEAAIQMALLAAANPAMQDGIELVGTPEEQMILAMAAEKVGLKILNPPETTPDRNTQKNFKAAQKKITDFVSAAATAAAAAAGSRQAPAEEDVAEDGPAEEDAPEEEAPEDDALEDDVPEDNLPEDDVPEDDVPEDDVPEDDVPGDDAPDETTVEQDQPEEDQAADDLDGEPAADDGNPDFEDSEPIDFGSEPGTDDDEAVFDDPSLEDSDLDDWHFDDPDMDDHDDAPPADSAADDHGPDADDLSDIEEELRNDAAPETPEADGGDGQDFSSDDLDLGDEPVPEARNDGPAPEDDSLSSSFNDQVDGAEEGRESEHPVTPQKEDPPAPLVPGRGFKTPSV